MFIIKNKLVLVLVLVFFKQSFANTNQFLPTLSADSSKLALSIGVLNGESKELVYYGKSNSKLSQLDWKIKNIPILKMNYFWDAYPYITFNAKGWASLNSANGYMDDYDWTDQTYSTWTDHSWHSNTRVNYGNEYDLNIKFWAIKNENIKLGILLGYQQTRLSWTARGGNFNYSKGTNIGSFTDQISMGYKLKMSAPYIGLSSSYQLKDFDFNLLLKFSNMVKMIDNDEHYARSLSFKDTTKNSNYYGAVFNVGYKLNDNVKLFGELTYNIYQEGRGDMNIYNNLNNSSSDVKGNIGISNINYDVNFGIEYQF